MQPEPMQPESVKPQSVKPEPVKYLRLDMEISVPYSDVLKGLDAWFELGLISDVDFRWRNTGRSANRLNIVAIENERILQGLELWLELGLVSDEQVRLIGTTRLNCEIKGEIKAPVSEPRISSISPIARSTTTSANVSSANITGSRLARSPIPKTPPVKPKTEQEPSKVAQTLRSLFSEFSTMWLLFLGVFLVVVSSGLLAASQWNNFPHRGSIYCC